MSPIALIDYGAGNLRSVHNALVAAGAEGVAVTADPDVVARADRIVLPGVGAFAACMNGLSAIDGLIEAMEQRVRGGGAPFLGICVGMQLMARVGHEYQRTEGLGWIDGEVEHISPSNPALKVPHMGWNDLVLTQEHPVLDGISTGDHAYFVHSYHMSLSEPSSLLAHADYGQPITAIVGRDTMVGTQFHPEKSQKTGLRLIANFLSWAP